MPHGTDAEVVETSAAVSSDLVKGMMILQLILTILLDSAIDDLYGLYFTLEMQVYLTLYDTVMPASAEIYLIEVTRIIEMELISPEGFIQMFYPEFDLLIFLKDVKVIMNKDNEESPLKEM